MKPGTFDPLSEGAITAEQIVDTSARASALGRYLPIESPASCPPFVSDQALSFSDHPFELALVPDGCSRTIGLRRSPT